MMGKFDLRWRQADKIVGDVGVSHPRCILLESEINHGSEISWEFERVVPVPDASRFVMNAFAGPQQSEIRRVFG